MIALASSAFDRLKGKILEKKEKRSSKSSSLICTDSLNSHIYAGEICSLKKKDYRKLSVFENDCLRSIVGVSRINHIKMDDVTVTLEYQIKSLTLSKKDWSGLVMWYTKTMSAISSIFQ